MQVNEHTGQVQQGTRLPDIDRALSDARATSETRTGRPRVGESRRTATKPETTRKPRYGSGF